MAAVPEGAAAISFHILENSYARAWFFSRASATR